MGMPPRNSGTARASPVATRWRAKRCAPGGVVGVLNTTNTANTAQYGPIRADTRQYASIRAYPRSAAGALVPGDARAVSCGSDAGGDGHRDGHARDGATYDRTERAALKRMAWMNDTGSGNGGTRRARRVGYEPVVVSSVAMTVRRHRRRRCVTLAYAARGR